MCHKFDARGGALGMHLITGKKWSHTLLIRSVVFVRPVAAFFLLVFSTFSKKIGGPARHVTVFRPILLFERAAAGPIVFFGGGRVDLAGLSVCLPSLAHWGFVFRIHVLWRLFSGLNRFDRLCAYRDSLVNQKPKLRFLKQTASFHFLSLFTCYFLL